MSSSSSPVVLLTGGGSGIGLKVLTKLLRDENAKVVVLTLEPTAELSTLEKEFGEKRIFPVYGDATDDSIPSLAVSETIKHFGYMSHLISCVGTMMPVEPIESITLDSYKRLFDINFFSVISVVQKALPFLQKSPIKSTIVIVSSGADMGVLCRGWAPYCSSKAALTRFIHVLAHEHQDISVFGVMPGVTQTPMVDLIMGGKYDDVMYPYERERFDTWAKKGIINDVDYIATSMVKAAMGRVKKGDPEVKYVNEYGSIFVQPVLPSKL